MEAFVGKYKMVSSENFDEFMKAIGVGMMMRKLGGSSKPVVEIKKDGDEWTVATTTTFKNTELKFKLGQEFEETRMDGTVVKTVITFENNKLVQKQFGEKEVQIVREIVNNQLKVVCTVDDIVSTRIYDRE